VTTTHFISKISEVDGQMSNAATEFWAGPPELEFLPGDHTLRVVFPTGERETIHFHAESGRSYKLDRWGNNPVIIRTSDNILVAPFPDANDVIVYSPIPEKVKAFGVGLVAIDGKSEASILRGFAVRLQPGPHKFELSFYATDWRGGNVIELTATKTVSVDLEPGCKYIVSPNVNYQKQVWFPTIAKARH
jgi:hypothetical protein